MLIKLILILKTIQIVNSIYQPIKLSDIKSLTFKKYQKTEGTYYYDQLNCTNNIPELCELYEPESITCFHKEEQWDCYSSNAQFHKASIHCESYPFTGYEGYIVENSCYVEFVLKWVQDQRSNEFNNILIFYFISVTCAFIFIMISFKKRRNFGYVKLRNLKDVF